MFDAIVLVAIFCLPILRIPWGTTSRTKFLLVFIEMQKQFGHICDAQCKLIKQFNVYLIILTYFEPLMNNPILCLRYFIKKFNVSFDIHHILDYKKNTKNHLVFCGLTHNPRLGPFVIKLHVNL